MIVGVDIATNVPEVTKKYYSFIICKLNEAGWGAASKCVAWRT